MSQFLDPYVTAFVPDTVGEGEQRPVVRIEYKRIISGSSLEVEITLGESDIATINEQFLKAQTLLP